jgi:hypothetical protein
MANGVFTTKPFNLGNTLTQVAQIQNLQSSNKLREAQLAELDRQTQVRNQLTGFDISDPANLNKLAGLGPEGLALAGKVTDLRTNIAGLEGVERTNAFEASQFLNRKARSIANSKDPRQRLFAEMQDQRFADMVNKIVPGFDPTTVTDENFLNGLQQVIEQTDFVNDPAAQTELLSGSAATDLGFAPGTVLEETTGPQGDVKRKILQKPPTAGLRVEVNPEGGFTFTQGGPAKPATSKTTGTKLEAKVIVLDDQLARLQGIRDNFDPEFLTVQRAFETAVTSIKAKLRFDVSKDEVEKLVRLGTWRQEAFEALNLYIKDITGAQMSENEAKRLRRGFPDPGDGIFDGDAPQVFISKLNQKIKTTVLARSRRIWAINNGRITPDIAPDKVGDELEKIVSLDGFEASINTRADELTDEFIKTGMNEATARQQALIQVKQEFQL